AALAAVAPMRLPLHQAHDRPFDAAEYLPEMHGRWLHRDAGSAFIGGEESFARTHAANRRSAAETPGACAEPAELFHGIAGMEKLQVQHRGDALRPADEIAEPKVAMHHCRSPGTRQMLGRPTKAEIERRQRQVIALINTAIEINLRRGIKADQKGQRR